MPIARDDITGLVLAGGRGTRMGGDDKGLALLHGEPLALRALRRLAPQVGPVAINANRELPRYARFGAPVWPDTVAGQPGPLAGMLAGLAGCVTPWLVTVPCDGPHFPPDVVARLGAAAHAAGSRIALAAAPDAAGVLHAQPVFCLVHVSLQDHLARHLSGGGRKVGAWALECGRVLVAFDLPGDDPDAFGNVNTPAELRTLNFR